MIVLFEPTTLILVRLSLLFPSGFRSGYLKSIHQFGFCKLEITNKQKAKINASRSAVVKLFSGI